MRVQFTNTQVRIHLNVIECHNLSDGIPLDLEYKVGKNSLYSCRVESCDYIQDYLLSNDGGEHLILFNSTHVKKFISNDKTSPFILDNGKVVILVERNN